MHCIFTIKRSCHTRLCSFFCALINCVYISNSYTDTYSHTHIHICCKSMKSYEIMLKILINFIGQVWRRSTIQVKACIRSRGMLAQADIKAIKDCNKRFGWYSERLNACIINHFKKNCLNRYISQLKTEYPK